MYKAIFSSELSASKHYTYLLLTANLLFFISGLFGGSGTYNFAGTSTVIFWVMIIAYSISYSDQKRCRLFSQLPTTHLQVFLATWAVALLWLVISVFFWISYGILSLSEFGLENVMELLIGAIAISSVTLLIAIAVDLGEFQPRYIQWLYIISLISFAIIANESEWTSHIGIRINEDSFSVFPFSFEGYGPIGILYGLVAFAVLFYVDFKVYEKSENFLH